MATTFFDSITGYYTRKFKALNGRYHRVKLGKPAPGADPNIIPPDILEAGEQYQDQARPALPPTVGIPTFGPKAVAIDPDPDRIDLYTRLESYYRLQSKVVRPGTLGSLRRIIDDFATFCRQRGIAYMDQVRAGTVKAYVDLQEQAPQTIKRNLSLLGKCWSQAIRYEEYKGQNPIRAVCHDLPSSDVKNRPDALTPEEVQAFMREIAYRKSRTNRTGPSSHLPQWVEDMVVVMLNTGLRIGAATEMRFDWCEGSMMTVPAEHSKSRHAYSTVINAKVADILQRRREELGPDAERVFPEAERNRIYQRLRYVALACVRKGEWKRDKGSYCHILRHTFITEQLRGGVPLVMVSKLAGHTSVAMTQRYDQTTAKDAIEWALKRGVTL